MIGEPVVRSPVAPLPGTIAQAVDAGGAVAIDTGAVNFECHNVTIENYKPDSRASCNQGGSGAEQAAATSHVIKYRG